MQDVCLRCFPCPVWWDTDDTAASPPALWLCVTVGARATPVPVTHAVPPPLHHGQAWLLSGRCLTSLRSALRSAQLLWVTPCSAAATR